MTLFQDTINAPVFYSCDIECYLLGYLLQDSARMIDVSVKEDDFFYPVHGELFTKMQTFIYEKGRFVVSDFTVWALNKRFTNTEEQERDGVWYIQRLIDGAWGVKPDINSLCAQIKELSTKRRIVAALSDAKNMLEDKDSREIMLFLQKHLQEAAPINGIQTAAQVREEILSGLTRPQECYPTGIKCLDIAMAGGLYAGYTYGFCGKEKAGKTTLAHTISYNLDCPHLYVALEMGAKQIEMRNMARDGGFNSLNFLLKPETIKLNTNVHNGRYYLDAQGENIQGILNHIATAKMKYGIKGFIIDYWQLVGGKDRNETEERHMRAVAQAFADFGRKHNLWCMLMAQMNKNGELFGGNGLRKACDQLYMLNDCGDCFVNGRWMRLDASRYTHQGGIGSEETPSLFMETNKGPFFHDANDDITDNYDYIY
jgi:replicative DNA helicase